MRHARRAGREPGQTAAGGGPKGGGAAQGAARASTERGVDHPPRTLKGQPCPRRVSSIAWLLGLSWSFFGRSYGACERRAREWIVTKEFVQPAASRSACLPARVPERPPQHPPTPLRADLQQPACYRGTLTARKASGGILRLSTEWSHPTFISRTRITIRPARATPTPPTSPTTAAPLSSRPFLPPPHPASCTRLPPQLQASRRPSRGTRGSGSTWGWTGGRRGWVRARG